MAQFCSEKEHNSDTKMQCFVLVLSWLLGFWGGILLFLSSEALTVSWMHGRIFTSVSIVSLFSIYFIPFLFTAFTVFISKLWLLIPIAFCKALLYGFASMWICTGFGSAGWLVRMLVMFSDDICVISLFFLWLRLLSGRKTKCFAEFVLSCTGCLLASVFDYYIISPFLAGLIEI